MQLCPTFLLRGICVMKMKYCKLLLFFFYLSKYADFGHIVIFVHSALYICTSVHKIADNEYQMLINQDH